MARITRKELKSDKFAQDIGYTVTFFEEHRKDLARYGVVALAVVVLGIGYMYYARHQHAVRQEALYKAFQTAQAPIGPAQPGGLSFPTQQAKDEQTVKAFNEIVTKYGGSGEGDVAEYFLGTIMAAQGKLADAEKYLLDVSQKGDEKYASLAKLSLAQIYFEGSRADQGEKMLRDLIAKPTIFVSADQATLALARQLVQKKPAEARKLLQPMVAKAGEAGQAANDMLAGLPQ